MALTGNEVLQVLGVDNLGRPAGTNELITTQAIANLALQGLDTTPIVNTLNTTVGNGTLTAAGLVGGYTTRTGPVSAFTDTTDTAANIIAALQPTVIPGFTAFFLTIINRTAYPETIQGGFGVTVSGGNVTPPLSSSFYLLSVTSATTVSMYQFFVSQNVVTPSVITPLNTVGNGTITATSIFNGITARGGAQLSAPFTDTTDTANNIVAAISNAQIGAAFSYIYQNNTNAVATINSGSGVTVSTITTIPPNSWAEYLTTYTAASTITMAGLRAGYFPIIGTVTLTGTTAVSVSNTSITTASMVTFTLKNVGGTVGAYPAIKTITTGTGFTVAGTVGDTSVYNYKIEG